MDRILQAAWDRHGSRYSWVLAAVVIALAFPVYLFLSVVIVAFESPRIMSKRPPSRPLPS